MHNKGIQMVKKSWRIFKKSKFVVNTASFAIIALASTSALAELPTGGEFVNGNGSIGTAGNTMNINQDTFYGIINWNGFSIGAENIVNISNGVGATLSRVTGNDPSSIYGQLNATGSAYLVNQNGIVVGPSGQINTGGAFVATTRDISNEDFLNGGDNTFSGNSNADVVNLGNITTGGDAVLLGKNVLNSGTINSSGDALLGAGNEILLTDTTAAGDRMFVQVGEGSVTNSGTISSVNAELRANGGNVFALAINNTGVVRANGLSDEGGRLILSAGEGTAQNSGTLDASSTTGNGGNIVVEGQNVVATATSVIDASGVENGGYVSFGGGYQGSDESIQNAKTANVEEGSNIDVSSENGNAGTAVVWSDEATNFQGSIDASSANGAGGLVEVSSKEELNFASWDVNVSGATENGELLIDPTNIDIVAGSGTAVSSSFSSSNTLFEDNIENWLQNNGNLTILTSSAGTEEGNITFEDGIDISWSSNSVLNLNATNDINFSNNEISASGSDIGRILAIAGNDINLNGTYNLLAGGSNGGVRLVAAGGNWASGTGSINFNADSTDISGKDIALFSGINANGNRSDLDTDVRFLTQTGTYRNFFANGFENVDINSRITISALSGLLASGSFTNIDSLYDIITEDGSFVINAANITLDENITTRGDFLVNAAAFDDTTNELVVGRNGNLSEGWLTNTGQINFGQTTLGNDINLALCCAVTLTSGLDANGNRVDLMETDATFTYNNDYKSYKWFEAKGFDTFDTTFEGNKLTTNNIVDSTQDGFISLHNINNNIDHDMESTNDTLVVAWNDTTITGSDITAGGDLTVVVDEETPFDAGVGSLNVDSGSNLSGSRIALFTSQQSNNQIDGTLNGVNFVEGPEFQSTAQEEWVAFYQNDDRNGEDPFKVFYKNQETISLRPDCSINPEAAGCGNFAEFSEQGKEYRVALTQDATEPEEGSLAWGNSSQIRNNEFYTIKSYDYVDTNLSTAEKVGTFWYALPIQLVNIPLSGLSEVPGIQSIAVGLKGITGGIQTGLNNVVVR